MNKQEPARTPTAYEKFVALARKIVQTPKADVDKLEQVWKEKRRRKRQGS